MRFDFSNATKRFGLGVFKFVLSASVLAASEPGKAVIHDAMSYPPPGSVIFQGRLGEAITNCVNRRIIAQNINELVTPFITRQEEALWRCEFWGKWFTSVAEAYRYQPQPRLRKILDEAVQGLMNTQSTNGDITTYKPTDEFSHWDTWGRKYTLLGLLAYCDVTGDSNALAAARRHADYVLDHFGPGKADIATNGKWSGMAASSILEPMVLLYRHTGDNRYLKFAEYIVDSWQEPKGPHLIQKALEGVPVFKMFPGPDPREKGYLSGGSSKAYEMMSCYEGLIELYRVTGDLKYFNAARKVYGNIRDTEITIIGSGSSWERWCNGRMRQAKPVPEWMETCVTVYWLKLASQLLRLTGDPTCVDEIERTTYNALLSAQNQDGTWWCHYSPLNGYRVPANDQCGMHMDCCVANGPRGLLLLPELAVMSAETGPVINFYEPSTTTLPLADGKQIRLEIKSDYPRSGVADITVSPTAVSKFTLSLRIPTWSCITELKINGKLQSGIRPGTYARLKRVWQPGDQVHVSLDFATRLVQDPGGSGDVAVMRGPIVFALDKRISKALPDQGEGRVQADAAGVIKAAVASGDLPSGIQLALDVPFITGNGNLVSLRFCDYASAGDTWSKASAFRVWLPQPLDLTSLFADAPGQ